VVSLVAHTGTSTATSHNGTRISAPSAGPGTTTPVGTPRNQTLIVQTFDNKTLDPANMNPLSGSYAIWRGLRELGLGYLWETNTATGQPYPELAAALPTVLDAHHTRFLVRLKSNIYWSDGVKFTADDVIYTLDTYFKHSTTLTYFGVPGIDAYVKSYKKINDYTLEIDTTHPAYDFVTTLGVYTWGSAFNIVPKHIFEKQKDLAAFKNTYPVTLGPYTVKSFDSNGQWQLWQRRSDWQRSSWGFLGMPAPKYVLYMNFGDEQTRTLAFIKNQYDVDTFMSIDSIQAAQQRNSNISTFSPTLPFPDMGDACSYGIMMNEEKAPLNSEAVRWALALALDLQNVGVNAMNGNFKASPLPMSDTPVLRPVYFTPLQSWLNSLTLPDGYRPYNPNFASDLMNKLKSMGAPASQLPQGNEAISAAFGLGWWKADPAEAQKLMASAGMKKNSSGFYTLPNGKVWQIDFVIPSDWNKVMERIGFSIADSWRKAGFDVTARQTDNGEWSTIANTNSLLTMELNWPTCTFNTNYLNSFRSIQPQYVKSPNATTQIVGDSLRITDPKVFALINSASSMDQSSSQFLATGRAVIKQMVQNMEYLNIMNIPTTIPTNNSYWTNFPKANNHYAVPYTWWSSFNFILVHIKPTGKQ
jgi:peptide/nickel transport system substrate-binding protein